MKKVILLVLGFVLALSLVAFQGEPPFESIEALLIWLAFGGGSAVIVGVVFALFVAQLPFWHRLPIWVQMAIPILLAALVGAGSRLLLDLGAYTNISPIVAALILAFVNWLASQAASTSSLAQSFRARALGKK